MSQSLPKKVLIVEDDQDILDVVSMILASENYVVRKHSTGFNVPDIVNDYKPDLVLLDINLPGKLGTDICKDLKAVSNHPPIVYFSAHANKEATKLDCAADGFIQKPFDIDELVSTVKLHTV